MATTFNFPSTNRSSITGQWNKSYVTGFSNNQKKNKKIEINKNVHLSTIFFCTVFGYSFSYIHRSNIKKKIYRALFVSFELVFTTSHTNDHQTTLI